jgi:hypothetical protein
VSPLDQQLLIGNLDYRRVSAEVDEDTPYFDHGGVLVVEEALREAFLRGKRSKPAVLTGTRFDEEMFRLLGCTYVPRKHAFIIARVLIHRLWL